MMGSEMERALEKVVAEQRKVGETVQPAADEAALAAERDELRERFGAMIPDDYSRFLRRTNGINFDGVVFYGVGYTEAAPGLGGFWQGLTETNRLWRDGPGRETFLVLGETDMDLLTVELDGTRPVLRDKVSNDVFEEFASVDDAIGRLLGSRFQPVNGGSEKFS